MISFRIPIVILLKSKPENTNHSYDKCVNEYTMNSLLPIPIAFSMLLKMSSCKKRSELYRTCILFFSFFQCSYCFLRCCNSTKEEPNYVDIHINVRKEA